MISDFARCAPRRLAAAIAAAAGSAALAATPACAELAIDLHAVNDDRFQFLQASFFSGNGGLLGDLVSAAVAPFNANGSQDGVHARSAAPPPRSRPGGASLTPPAGGEGE
jgi:hypothetical protein